MEDIILAPSTVDLLTSTDIKVADVVTAPVITIDSSVISDLATSPLVSLLTSTDTAVIAVVPVPVVGSALGGAAHFHIRAQRNNVLLNCRVSRYRFNVTRVCKRSGRPCSVFISVHWICNLAHDPHHPKPAVIVVMQVLASGGASCRL